MQVHLLRSDIILIHKLIATWSPLFRFSCIGLSHKVNFLRSQGVGDNIQLIILHSYANWASMNEAIKVEIINIKIQKLCTKIWTVVLQTGKL